MRFCLAFIFFFSPFAYSTCLQSQCLAIVDAGSSGSRVHIYSYDLDETKTPINITERWIKKIRTSFSMLELDQSVMNNYLTSLFSDAPEKNIPVYFFATAGMRLMPQPKQQHYYALLHRWFQDNPQWKLASARTITGHEEGLFGWLAVNYQLGELTSNAPDPVGIVDVGGASVQIAFPVNESAHLINDNIQSVDLYGHHLNVFIHSFLGLGQNEMSHQLFEVSACFSSDYLLPTGLPADGNAYLCKDTVSSLLNEVHHVNQVMQTVIRTYPIKRWFVLGGMAELVRSKPFQFVGHQLTSQDLLEQADTVCHQSWTTLSTTYPENDYLYGYCLFSSFYYALLVEGYGMQPQQPIHFLQANQVSNWTLGVILAQNSP